VEGGPWLQLVWQHPGDQVHVPPGWLHQVQNLRPNIKLAYDVYCMQDFGLYLKRWARLVARLFARLPLR
jgi:dTDP-4-dehydrorhamnose 3,5-epimerase-like enzyme